MRRALTLVLLLAAAAPAAAVPTITAHRGGPLKNGVAIAPENSLPAFARAAAHRWTLEFDVSLTEDGVPVVIHDDRLDRTTNCTGLVKDRTAAELRADCRIDVLGIAPSTRPITDASRQPFVPTLDEVLALAARWGATISPEIKNLPPTTQGELTEGDDFDPNPMGFATTVSRALAASGYPQQRMIVQSFWPPNLDVAASILPDAQLSFLTLEQMNEPGPEFAAVRGYDWVSPGFTTGLSDSYVERAHSYGRKVTVYTPDTRAQLAAARDAGVDTVITNDPDLAERVVR